MECLELKLEGFANIKGPHARDAVGIITGVVGCHHGLFQVSKDTATSCVMVKEKKNIYVFTQT